MIRNSFLKALFGVLLLLCIQLPMVAAEKTATADDGFEQMNGEAPATDTAHSASEDDWFADDSAVTTPAHQAPAATQPEEHAPIYPLLEIGSVTLLLYFLSWLLARTKVMKTATHRKIWNVILLIAFMVSGLLGLMLVVQINYDIWGKWFATFMWLHVDFGIVMGIVSIFHIFWHTKYFGTLLKSKK